MRLFSQTQSFWGPNLEMIFDAFRFSGPKSSPAVGQLRRKIEALGRTSPEIHAITGNRIRFESRKRHRTNSGAGVLDEFPRRRRFKQYFLPPNCCLRHGECDSNIAFLAHLSIQERDQGILLPGPKGFVGHIPRRQGTWSLKMRSEFVRVY